MCGNEEETYNSSNNNNNIGQPVVQSKLPLCKRNLATLVMSNEKYNSVPKKKKLLTILEEPDVHEEPTTGYLDTAAPSHFITTICPGKTIEHKPMYVGCANIMTMDSITTKEININLLLSKKGKTASVMLSMKANLISVPQLSDDGCTCQLHKMKAIVTCSDTTVISDRNVETRLWTIPIESKNEKENTKGDVNPIVPTNKIATLMTELKNSKQTGITEK